MPRNPHKRRCAVPGCRAWAIHRRTVCASHRDRGPHSPAEQSVEQLGLPPSRRALAGEKEPSPLTADYTLDDLAAHAAVALNRLQAWYAAHAAEDDPRVVMAYVRQLYQCLARLADLWKQRASMGESELAAALNGALADLQVTFTAQGEENAQPPDASKPTPRQLSF